ncbi:hypothetical protein QTP88_011821 [Uroleucon formosanum]
MTPRDNRGKHLNRPYAIDAPVRDLIRQHINSLPRQPSHYSRIATDNLQCLSSDLNLCKLFRSFKNKYPDINVTRGLGQMSQLTYSRAGPGCVCQRAYKNNKEPNEHMRFKNWNFSSTAMEAEMVNEYSRLIVTVVMNKLHLAKTYGSDFVIKKIECWNHILRNYVNKLKDIATERRTNRGMNIPGNIKQTIKDRILILDLIEIYLLGMDLHQKIKKVPSW